MHDLTGNVLTDAYRSDAPCVSLIYGTGVNAALDFPAQCVAPEKFPRGTQTPGSLPASVIMNTELSTYGKHVLPTTSWDEQLNRAHARPDIQPLEYLIGGRYLGEIVRLIVADAVHKTGLLGGHLPSSLSQPYSLDTELVADIERDPTTALERMLEAEQYKATAQGPRVTGADSLFVQRICQAVSNRAAAYLATALHALWVLRNECRASTAAPLPLTGPAVPLSPSLPPPSSPYPPSPPSAPPVPPASLRVSYHGSVIAKYPGLKERCQMHLDQLTCRTNGGGGSSGVDRGGSGAGTGKGSLALHPALDATALGAAVALACNPPNL